VIAPRAEGKYKGRPSKLHEKLGERTLEAQGMPRAAIAHRLFDERGRETGSPQTKPAPFLDSTPQSL
jgi:hypothetical protein